MVFAQPHNANTPCNYDRVPLKHRIFENIASVFVRPHEDVHSGGRFQKPASGRKARTKKKYSGYV